MKIRAFTLSVFLFFSSCLFAQYLEGTNIPADTTYNANRVFRQIKNDFPYTSLVEEELTAGVVEERNLVYTKLEDTPFGSRELHLDLFHPEKTGKYPVLVMVHGGGWRSGNKSLQIPMAQIIASHGFVTVAVEYQLSLEASYPAAVHNIKAAIRWLRANASQYNMDTSRIAISGCSAGGQLAALVGLTNGIEKFEGNMGNREFSSHVHALIDIDGVINFMAPNSLNLHRNADSPDIAWLGGSFTEKPEVWREASSIYWVKENSIPVLFLNSGFSRFHAGQDEMIGMYKELGIYHEVHQFNVDIHPFWLFHPWADMSINYMVDFLDRVMN